MTRQQAESQRGPIRERRFSQRIHVTRKQFSLRFRIRRSASRSVLSQTPRCSQYSREFFLHSSSSTWRVPIGQTRPIDVFRSIAFCHVAMSQQHTTERVDFQRMERRQIRGGAAAAQSGNMSSSTNQKLDRLLSVMEHFFSCCKVQVNPDMDSSYLDNYGDYSHEFFCATGRALTDVQTSFAFTPEEDVSDDTLTNLEVREDIQPEDYVMEISKECEVFQIEPEIIIALNEGENEMKIDVDSDKPEMQQIESKEDQPLVLVRPPTLPYTYGTPYKGVEVRERLQIFYTADTFVLDDPDTIDSFVLEVPDELLNLKEGVHASLPNYVDASFVVDISKGEGIT
ncbi:hypothetical protein Syun_014397 [Stephania yunnanensis]|uniref:Uncharacterized protein n=1 Tax=Stephania yunnanensis TaxID=152371 RepID=A0AAP0P8Q3_9MAGN